TVHDLVQDYFARAPECARPGHDFSCASSSWMVISESTSNSRLPEGVTTMAVSPTFFPMRARPIGEEVEISPLLMSDSSLVTSLYSMFSSLVESYTRTVDPNAALSRGLLFMLISDRSPILFFN